MDGTDAKNIFITITDLYGAGVTYSQISSL